LYINVNKISVIDLGSSSRRPAILVEPLLESFFQRLLTDLFAKQFIDIPAMPDMVYFDDALLFSDFIIILFF